MIPACKDKTAGQPFCTTNVARRAKYMDVLSEQGGLLKAQALFGKELPVIVQELNGYLIA
jgi:hypothetical protein